MGVDRGAGSPSPHLSQQGGQGCRAPVEWDLLRAGALGPHGVGWGPLAPPAPWWGVGLPGDGLGSGSITPGWVVAPSPPAFTGSVRPLLMAAASRSAGRPAAVRDVPAARHPPARGARPRRLLPAAGVGRGAALQPLPGWPGQRGWGRCTPRPGSDRALQRG